jgi:hypothetical protein
MNLSEYLHFQARTSIILLNSSQQTSADLLIKILNILNDKLRTKYLTQYSISESERTSAKSDILISQEMKTFFETGTLPPGFVFESVQMEFSKKTSSLVSKMNKKEDLIVDVQNIEDSEKALRVDVKDNIVGFRFKALLCRKICFVLDSLYFLLKLNLNNEDSVLEGKFGDSENKEIYMKKEKVFLDLTEKIFENVFGMEEALELCRKLKFKLDILYEIFEELLVLVGDSQAANCYGLNDNAVISDYKDFHNEMKTNRSFLSEVGRQNIYYIDYI